MIDFETARKYRDEQGYPVFPVKIWWNNVKQRFEKNPLPGGSWKPYQDRLPTDEELHQWFDRPVWNGIGFATGKLSGVVVVDNDSYKKNSQLGEKLESEMIVKTISGGEHFYFGWDEEMGSTTGVDKSPIDFRGDGGFIVLPPSECDGKKYEWKSECPIFVLQPLPSEVKKIIRQRRGNEMPPESPLGSSGVSMVTKVSYEYLSSDVEPASEGNRDNDGTVFVGKLLRELPPHQWLKFGYPRFVEWNSKNTPPMDIEQVNKIWKSVCNAELRNHPDVVKMEESLKIPTPLTMREVIDKNKQDTEMAKGCPTTGLASLDKMIKGFIPGHTYLLAGDTNTGKTSTCCFFAIAVARQGKKVLYLALEPGAQIVNYMASIVADKTFDQVTEADKEALATLPIDVYEKEQVRTPQRLLEILKSSEHYDLAIIDHLGYFIKNSPNVNQEQSDVMKMIAEISTSKRMAVLAIPYLRKMEHKKKSQSIPTLDDISGSASFKFDATDVWILYKEKDLSDQMGATYLDRGFLIVYKSKNSASGAIKIAFGHGKAGIKEFSSDPFYAVNELDRLKKQSEDKNTVDEITKIFTN